MISGPGNPNPSALQGGVDDDWFGMPASAAPAPPPAFAPAPQARPAVRPAFTFDVKGHELQFLQIELPPGGSCIAEAGVMMFKQASVTMEAVVGAAGVEPTAGFFGKFIGGAKRALSGASFFVTRFTQTGAGPGTVAFAAQYPGKIIPIRLDLLGGVLFCQKNTFLAGSEDVTIDIALQKKVMTGLFGGEGFILQRLSGNGWVFIHAGGAVVERELAPGEELHVEAGCLVAQTATVSFDIVPVGGVKSMFFGGEGFYFARLIGPGHVWMQSMPFSKLAARIAARAPGAHVGVAHDIGGGSSWGSSGSTDSGVSSDNVGGGDT